MQRVPDDIRRRFTDGQIERETPLIVNGKRAQPVSQPAGQRRQGNERRRKFCMLRRLHLLPQLRERAVFIRIDAEYAIHPGQGEHIHDPGVQGT